MHTVKKILKIRKGYTMKSKTSSSTQIFLLKIIQYSWFLVCFPEICFAFASIFM